MKSINEIRNWIVCRYGPIIWGFRGGEYIAVVPVYDGWAVGIGSRRANAIYDLRLSLCMTGIKKPPRGMSFLPWEKQRQKTKRERLTAEGVP